MVRRHLLLVPLALLIGCPAKTRPAPGPDSPAKGWREVSSPEGAGYTKAAAARDALVQTLKGRLQQAVQDGGPESAISVCKQAAPAIAEQVAADQGVKIGRTSFKLRNPANRAPAWAGKAIARKAESPAYFKGPEGAVGALYPLKTGSLCVMCHGPEQSLSEPVRKALTAQYPEDRATGFEAGSLRGWVWVEVP